jgi:hypothetical protein
MVCVLLVIFLISLTRSWALNDGKGWVDEANNNNNSPILSSSNESP